MKKLYRGSYKNTHNLSWATALMHHLRYKIYSKSRSFKDLGMKSLTEENGKPATTPTCLLEPSDEGREPLCGMRWGWGASYSSLTTMK